MTSTKNWMESMMYDIAEMGEIDIVENTLQINDQNMLRNKLIEVISYLIDHNFEKLLLILYRIDVDEEKAKTLLSKNLPSAAPEILADLIIQRQIKKEEVKRSFTQYTAEFTDDEDLRL